MKTKRNSWALERRCARHAGHGAALQVRSRAFVMQVIAQVLKVAVCIGLFAGVAFIVHDYIVRALQAVVTNAQFTQPVPGVTLGLSLCVGFILSVPVMVHGLATLVRSVRPMRSPVKHMMMVSTGLLLGGLVFGYFWGLPRVLELALPALTDVTRQVQNEAYVAFSARYLAATALLSQLPIVTRYVRRICHPSVKTLLMLEPAVIVLVSVQAAIISQSLDSAVQLAIALPAVVSYQVYIGTVWAQQKRAMYPTKLLQLLEQDITVQAERLAVAERVMAQSLLRFEPALVPITSSDDSPVLNYMPGREEPLPFDSQQPALSMAASRETVTIWQSESVQTASASMVRAASTPVSHTKSQRPLDGRTDFRNTVRDQRVRRRAI